MGALLGVRARVRVRVGARARVRVRVRVRVSRETHGPPFAWVSSHVLTLALILSLTTPLTPTPALTLTLTRQVRDAARVHGYRYGWPCAC